MQRITGIQLSYIGAGYVLNSTLISIPTFVFAAATVDSWLSYFIAMAATTVILWLLSRVSARFPSRDLFSILTDRAPITGRLVSLGYVGFFYGILIRDVRTIVDFIDISLLPMTPNLVIAVLVMLPIVWMVFKGVEVTARVTQIWQPLLLIAVTLIGPPLSQDFHFEFLYPAFEFGIMPAFHGSWYLLPYVAEITALPFLAAGIGFRFRYGMYGLIAGIYTLQLLSLYTLLTLGPDIPARTLYPNYEMVRQIRITDFLDRLDLILVGIWLPALIVKTGFSLYLVCRGLEAITTRVKRKASVIPVGVITVGSSFWVFYNTLSPFEMNRYWSYFGLAFQFGLPILMYVFLRPKPLDVAPNSPASS